MGSVPAAGGGRWVEVDPERLVRWLAGFEQRHGGYVPARTDGDGVAVRAADGEVARLYPPPGAGPAGDLDELVAVANEQRRLGLVLVRRGGYAIGVADGTGLTSSKVDSRYVQSRTAAGGWSQQRFARRRENQARATADSTADVVARIVLPECRRLAAVVTGGDRGLVSAVLADPRLAPLRPLVAERFLAVPDPRLVVLQGAVKIARAVRIHLHGSV